VSVVHALSEAAGITLCFRLSLRIARAGLCGFPPEEWTVVLLYGDACAQHGSVLETLLK
jgi:hypothetical protein